MKNLIVGLCLSGCASAANAAAWGEFVWGASAWGAIPTPIPVDSPIALLGLGAALAGVAVWFLKKRR